MLEMLTYMLAGIILYFVSDQLLVQIEIMRGKPFAEYRSVVFFGIILSLSLVVFSGIRAFLGG